jgi:hypothetical protein
MDVKSAKLTNVTVDSLTSAGSAEVKDGELVLTLAPGQAVMIMRQQDPEKAAERTTTR